jgi:hypothetical protein
MISIILFTPDLFRLQTAFYLFDLMIVLLNLPLTQEIRVVARNPFLP